MEATKNQTINIQCLTKKDAHYFFGYYDIAAVSKNQKYHLVHKVKFMNRLPNADDVAEIGVINIQTKEYTKLTETTAWNFQQGAMLQWHPLFPDEKIIYNERIGSNYRGVIFNILTGEKEYLSMPVAAVSPKGDYALGINFKRIYDYRSGYGYVGEKDEFYSVHHSDKDGVFLIDLKTGENKLIISYEYLWALTKDDQKEPERKLLVNHITFNTDGTRFVFLLRCFPTVRDSDVLVTSAITSDLEGKQLKKLLGYTMASHYNWRDEDHLLIYSDGPEDWQLYLIDEVKGLQEVVDREYFIKDGHCSYSPDKKWILYDSYPDQDSYSHLYLYNVEQKKGIELSSFYCDTSLYSDIWDARCDLHPRWMPDGKAISFDSVHEGKRQVYYADLTNAMNMFEGEIYD